jgi:hypothetical protein
LKWLTKNLQGAINRFVIRPISRVKKPKITLDTVSQLMLALALFFNPLGYDGLFAFTMKLTYSYWSAVAVFYFIAASFFATYLILRRRIKSKSLEKISNDID